MADKSTDILVSKDLAINIRYFSEKQRKEPDCLLEIVSMSSGTGDFNAIKKTLKWYCLDSKKCIGFGCYGASVMVGKHNSVWSRIKEVNINPSCILMKCIRHSLALCVQHGFKKLSSNLGYLLQEIPAWFSQSRIRCHEYKAKFMAELNTMQKNDGNSENTLLVVKQRCL